MLEKELTGYINPGVCLIFALLKVIDFFFFYLLLFCIETQYNAERIQKIQLAQLINGRKYLVLLFCWEGGIYRVLLNI